MLNRRQIAAALAAMAAAGGATQAAAHTAPGDPDNGSVWWSDLFTNDPAKAHAFYSKVFGWTPKIVALDDPSRAPKAGEKEYTLFTAGGHETAGAEMIDAEDKEEIEPTWVTYIQVADVDAAAGRATEAGGTIVHEPTDVPSVGRIALVSDPEGALFGLVRPLRR
jgi:predicted enzyme related to lactoylglutathione lyase